MRVVRSRELQPKDSNGVVRKGYVHNTSSASDIAKLG